MSCMANSAANTNVLVHDVNLGAVQNTPEMPEAIRIVLADDHPIVLHGLAQLFARQPDVAVIETCADGAAAIAAVQAHRPDVLVLDLRMQPLSGLDVLRALARDQVPCRSMILTAAVSDDEVVET